MIVGCYEVLGIVLGVFLIFLHAIRQKLIRELDRPDRISTDPIDVIGSMVRLRFDVSRGEQKIQKTDQTEKTDRTEPKKTEKTEISVYIKVRSVFGLDQSKPKKKTEQTELEFYIYIYKYLYIYIYIFLYIFFTYIYLYIYFSFHFNFFHFFRIFYFILHLKKKSSV